MIQRSQRTIQTAKSPDVIIVGAGIFGLWAARRAIQAGKRVLVLEKAGVGAGASGGFLGALMPHMPDRWDAKKQFQFDGLASLEQAITVLEADTGMNCGYRRCGRLMPIRSETSFAEIDTRARGALKHWRGRFRMERIEPPLAGRIAPGWLDEAQAPCGVQWDDFSARIDPRACLAALAQFARDRGELREGAEVIRLNPEAGAVVLADGSILSAGEIVVANGWQAYDLLQPFMGPINAGARIGRGVKGQGVLVEFAHGDDLPIVFSDGVYVVPQAENRVAVGATTDDDWQNGDHPLPDAFDPGNMAFHERALALVPVLRDAPIVERWANVRPRNTLKGSGTAPFLGPVPGYPNLTALTGGFKIGLGVAHLGDAPHPQFSSSFEPRG